MGIQVSEVTKVYGPQKAVDNISFEVTTGEIVGFLGPNGAGKSTTMKIITCYVTPTSGQVTLDGFRIDTDTLEVRKRIGYLPENNPLYPDMSIVDYLTYTAELQNVPCSSIPRRIRDMIDICGLGSERHKLIGELSKGYRQRVGLAQALIHDPEVLILDEPTAGLDPNQIVEIRELIKQIGKEKTVMLSSHILKEVEMTCDRMIIISKGKIVANGSAEELTKRAEGSERILVHIKNGGDERTNGHVGEALLNLAPIAGVHPSEDVEGAWIVNAKPNSPARESIFELCVSRHWKLWQLTPLHTSLEDVFRELTLNDNKSQQG